MHRENVTETEFRQLPATWWGNARWEWGKVDEIEEFVVTSRDMLNILLIRWVMIFRIHSRHRSNFKLLGIFFCCYSRTFETSFVSTKYIRVEKFVFSRFHSDSHSDNFFVFVSFAWITCLSFPIYQMFIFSNVEEIFFSSR